MWILNHWTTSEVPKTVKFQTGFHWICWGKLKIAPVSTLGKRSSSVTLLEDISMRIIRVKAVWKSLWTVRLAYLGRWTGHSRISQQKGEEGLCGGEPQDKVQRPSGIPERASELSCLGAVTQDLFAAGTLSLYRTDPPPPDPSLKYSRMLHLRGCAMVWCMLLILLIGQRSVCGQGQHWFCSWGQGYWPLSEVGHGQGWNQSESVSGSFCGQSEVTLMWPELGLSVTGNQFILNVVDVDEICRESCELPKPQLLKGCLPLLQWRHTLSRH